MRVAGPDLRVAVQKQALVVCDPVKHLPERKRQPAVTPREETTGGDPGMGLDPERVMSFL